MSTMGELNYRFERAVFNALTTFEARRVDMNTKFEPYIGDLQDFVRLAQDIRSTLDIAEYQKKLEEFEERFN